MEYSISFRSSSAMLPGIHPLTCSGRSLKKTTGGPVSSSIFVMGGMSVLRKMA